MIVTRRTFLGLPAVLWLPACGSERFAAAPAGSVDGGATPLPDGARPGVASGPFRSGPEPAPWIAPGSEDAAAFPSGVQTGDATASSVMVSLRTAEVLVDVRLMRGSDSGWEPAGNLSDLAADSGVVRLELGDLAPDTTYALAFYSKDGARRSRVARLRTALPAGERRTVRFGATSCLGLVGAPFASLTQCSQAGPLDFFCLLGDTVYADGRSDFEAVWTTALGQKGLVDITAATSVVGTWDDHEVDNNWSWSTPGMLERRDAALAAFNRSIPHRDGPSGSKLFRKLSWGQTLDLFVLDCRDERKDGDYVGGAQMDWFKAELEASTARFKIVLNSVPIIDFSATSFGNIQAGDRWQGYPQRAEILEHIKVKNVTGVLWLSGDFHFGLVSRVGKPGELASDQYEVLCGPAGSNINAAAQTLQVGEQIKDVVPERNSVLFEADPDAGTVQVRFVGNAGQTIAERVLTL